MNGLIFLSFLLITFLFSLSSFSQDQYEMFLEVGSVWQARNDTQISPTAGTRVEIDNLNSGPFFHHRLEGYYKINKKHALRAVYAPLSIKVKGPIDSPIVFNQETFNPGSDLTIRYKFNSYRLSYIYGFWGFEDDRLNLGVTAKVRDAATTFQQSGLRSTYDNVGFVPLVYFEYQKTWNPLWSLNITMDAAFAPQGRAIDAAIKIRRLIKNKISAGLGLRTLEGGADNDKVYTFSWFNYLTLDLKTSF